jgi:glycosyltransferase involved in cell wall biosynthesis
LADGVVVLHAIQHRRAPLAGTGRYTRELAAALPGAGEPVRPLVVHPWEVRVAGRRIGGLASIQVQHLVRGRRSRDLLHSVNAYMMHPKADLVTLHDLHPQRFGSAWGMAASGVRLMRARVDGFARRGGHFVTPTAAVKAQLLEHHPAVVAERVHVSHEGISDAFRPAEPGAPRHPAFDPEAFNVLVVADLHPRKRLDLVVEAAARVTKAGDGAVKIVQVGTDRRLHPAWEHQARREAVAEKRFGGLVRLGHVGEAGLVQAYQGADLVVAATDDEGFGFPPLEALRCGTPVAVTDLPVFRELLGDRALYFSDVDGLERALGQAMRRRPLPAQRRAWHGFVRDTYTWERTARLTCEAYAAARVEGRGAGS